MEYTLEDALETLQDTKMERQREMEDLVDVLFNNGRVALSKTSNAEEIQGKRHKMCQCLLNEILKEEPRDYPVPKTSDLHIEAVRELEEEVLNTQQLLDKMKAHLADIQDDISYLENKKMGLAKMKEASLDAAEMIGNRTYTKEHVITKRIFQTVKADLFVVVDTLFPGNEDFRQFLAALTSAYIKGGNDLYLDITPEVVVFVNFLIEANIAVYHRNDKSKVRLMDML